MILAAVLILFGAKKVPELMGGLGKGIKEFKKATREVSDEMNSAMEDNPLRPEKITRGDGSQRPAQPVSSQTTPVKKPEVRLTVFCHG